MKRIIIIFSLILSTCLALYSIEVRPTSGPYYVGQIIRFRGTSWDYYYYPGTLYFGDGERATNVRGGGIAPWIRHIYKSPGTYNLRLTNGAAMGTDEFRTIIIAENRYIIVSNPKPKAGEEIIFEAANFNTPNDILWNMGDGTILRTRRRKSSIKGGSVVTHTYTKPGNYTVKAYDWNGNASYVPVQISVNIGGGIRAITYTYTPSFEDPRVDQPVTFQALYFLTSSIDWNFGDGNVSMGNGTTVVYRYQTPGTYTVSAKDSTINHTPATTTIHILPENRRIEVSSNRIATNQEITATAYNFRGDFVLWDFGDGTQRSDLTTVRHTYTRSGKFTISAQDENGESQKKFEAQIIVGITDEVLLEIAEIKFDNGKYYKIVARNSKNNHTVLTMKMRGTGIVSGKWIVDNHPYEFFNEVVYRGELKKIYTKQIPGLPTIEPGLHTVTLELTRPSDIQVTFPILKYYVLPYEVFVETVSPPDGFVAKEKEIPEFSWKEPRGGVKYQIAFSNYLYPFLYNTGNLKWIDVKNKLKYTPGSHIWNEIKRNRWTYWKVRALDILNNVVAESDIMDIKIIVGTAEVTINQVTDLNGKEIRLSHNRISTRAVDLLIQGSITYEGDSKFLLLRVYADDELVDQLLFRNLKKKDMRNFETSIPNKKKTTKVLFQVLKTSSPAVIVGIKMITLKK